MELSNTESKDSILDLLFDDLDPVIGSDDFALPLSLLHNTDSTTTNNDVSWELFSDLLTTNSSSNDLDLASVMKYLPDTLLEEPPTDFQPFSDNSDSSASLTDEKLTNSSTTESTGEGNVELPVPSITNVNIFIDVDKEEASLSPQIASSSPEQTNSSSEEILDTQADETSIVIVPFYYEEIVEDVPMEIKEEENPVWSEVKLSFEEKRLLDKEGVTLPSFYPLTKEEERELKRIRRKIRNKHSAQDSRKKKKVYIDGLESRVKSCSQQNDQLKKKVQQLELRNKSLITELRKLQAVIAKYGNKHVQSSTCVLVLLLSFVFIISPNLWPGLKSKELSSGTMSGNSRVLLSDPTYAPLSEESDKVPFANMGDSSMKNKDVVRWKDKDDGAQANKWQHYSVITNTESSDYQANSSTETSNNAVTVEVPLVS